MKLSAKSVAALVAVSLVGLASASALAYWRLKPAPLPAQVIYGSGRFEADEVRIASEVPGRLLETFAEEGRQVSEGAVLARLDQTDYSLQADRAAAEVAAIAQTIKQIQIQIELADHHAGTAQNDLVRYESLASQGAVSRQQLELVRNGYVAAIDQVRLLKQQRAEALARSSAAAKLLALARSQLGKTIINAPRSGAVLERLAEPGEVIAAGQPIAVIADISRVRLKIYVGERDLGRVRLDAPVRIHIDAFAGRNFEGRVTRVDAQAQFTPRDVHMQDERSRTVYGVRLEAANPESLLKPGMPADAWILWDEKAGWPSTLRAPE